MWLSKCNLALLKPDQNVLPTGVVEVYVLGYFKIFFYVFHYLGTLLSVAALLNIFVFLFLSVLRIRIRGSKPLTNGMDPGDPAIFIIDLQDANKKLILLKQFFCILLFKGTITSFSKIKSQKEVTKQ